MDFFLKTGLEFGDAVLGGAFFPDMKTFFMGSEPMQPIQKRQSSSPTPGKINHELMNMQ